MARFPIREADIKTLAQSIISGLADNAATFPAPPVSPAALQAALDSFITMGDACVAARAAAEQATAAKNAGRVQLTDLMKAILRYAEDTVDYEDALLTLLGWGAMAAPTALQPPGQPGTLEIESQGEGWVSLDWTKPVDGGAVASYKIERRGRPSGAWMLIDLAYECETKLSGQDRTTDWEYRVVASNKAGEGLPSNIAGRLET